METQRTHSGMSSSKNTKHSRYYANHRLERRAQSREYKRKRTAAAKENKQSTVIPPSSNRPQLSSLRGENHAAPMYQEFITLRNSIDDWLTRAVPQYPVMKSEFVQHFSTYLLSGGSLSSDLHVFLDRYICNLAAFDDLDIWQLFKSLCAMQQALGSGRARLVFEVAPQMEIPQPSWGGSTLWVPRSSSSSTETIYQCVLKLRDRTDRLKKISHKMQGYKGTLTWRYEEVENCIQSGRDLYLDWYTMLDDVEEDPAAVELLMFLKEVSRTMYDLGQHIKPEFKQIHPLSKDVPLPYRNFKRAEQMESMAVTESLQSRQLWSPPSRQPWSPPSRQLWSPQVANHHGGHPAMN
ncbi:hypothetical protein GYMLUDRAFT_65212 [Collybiopsis luxurians FD-317 M1]|uniref:Uncharacterized protein n=1 Tax=Collybiopsis luxurians FD-317 M1 TaxID=944289 RepID=A0A0D0BYR7_9AGAR|nr:hypothetical protein GYMLUDRAFT_65212 [Collybiopsis luxurians FD-317 M1]